MRLALKSVSFPSISRHIETRPQPCRHPWLGSGRTERGGCKPGSCGGTFSILLPVIEDILGEELIDILLLATQCYHNPAM